ncbi:MAG: hypothetical protein AAB847_02935 [Patescibacteria group bacterium]
MIKKIFILCLITESIVFPTISFGQGLFSSILRGIPCVQYLPQNNPQSQKTTRDENTLKGLAYNKLRSIVVIAPTQEDADNALNLAERLQSEIYLRYFKTIDRHIYDNKNAKSHISIDLRHCASSHSGKEECETLTLGKDTSPASSRCYIKVDFNQEDLLKSACMHEFTHAIFNNQYHPHTTPPWFDEVIATLEESKIDQLKRSKTAQILLRNGDFPSLQRLLSKEKIQSAGDYAALYYFGKFLLTKGDSGKLIKLLDAYLANNKNTTKSFKEIYGYNDLQHLEKDFRAWAIQH